jgi:2-dehydro-3-deoxygluconokinase
MGKSGTMVATADRQEVIPARPVAAVDATGAGDTFDGAFLAEWLIHGNPFQAAAYANAAAALSTLGQGAVAPMPRRSQVERFLQAA